MPKASTRTSKMPTRERDDESGAELEHIPLTELGRLALAARRDYFASGGHPLSRDEIGHEIAERRGGTHLLPDR